MQIITYEQIFQVIVNTKELTQNLYTSFLFAALQNAEYYGMSTWVDIVNFHNPAINILMAIGSIAVAYRLVRNKLSMAIKSILSI